MSSIYKAINLTELILLIIPFIIKKSEKNRLKLNFNCKNHFYKSRIENV